MEVLHVWRPDDVEVVLNDTNGEIPSGTGGEWLVHFNQRDGCYEQLYTRGNCVWWYQGLHPGGRTLRKMFHVERPILQTCFCWFRKEVHGESGRVRCVCVREQGLLTLFLETGVIQYVSLPFPVRGVHLLEEGLLLERSVIKGDSTAGDGLATMFTLHHPLGDLCPVSFRVLSSQASSGESSFMRFPVGYFTSPSVSVVSMCLETNPALLLTHNAVTNSHSLWAIRSATTEDIPSPACTPGKARQAANSTPHPLSSSAPARIQHRSPGTPIHFVLQSEIAAETGSAKNSPLPLSGKKFTPSQRVDALKHPIVAKFQRWGSPYAFATDSTHRKRQGGSPMEGVEGEGSGLKPISGRSPFCKMKTPALGQPSSLHMKKAKSLSPPLQHARISPFSQTVNSRSWSAYLSEESLGEQLEPLLPQTCLHLLWTEPQTSTDRMGKGSDVFLTQDFTGTQCLAITASSLLALRLLKLLWEGDVSVGGVSIVTGVQHGIPLKGHQMFLTLTVQHELVLFSGDRRVSVVDLAPVHLGTEIELGGRDLVVAIKGGEGPQFSVVMSSGLVCQCSLPLATSSPLEEACLKVLSTILPSSVLADVLISHYRLVLDCSGQSSAPGDDQWDRFEMWFLACLGAFAPSVGRDESKPFESPWEELFRLPMVTNLSVQLPALCMLNNVNNITTAIHGKEGNIGRTDEKWPLEQAVFLHSYSAAIVSGLHLVYEDMKLDIHQHYLLPRMAGLLHRMASFLGWLHYVDYYCRDQPSLFLKYYDIGGSMERTSSECDMTENKPLYSRSSPPSIFDWLLKLIREEEVEPYPVLGGSCERTKAIVKIYSSLVREWGRKERHSERESVLWEIVGCAGAQDCEMTEECSAAEMIIQILTKNECLYKGLSSLPVGVSLPVWSALLQHQNDPPLAWPFEGYNIIGRSDIAKTIHQFKVTPLQLERSTDNDDGMEIDDEVLRLKFPTDLRVKELRRLLSCSQPVRVALKQKPEVSDHEFVEQQENYLMMVCRRTMSLPVGRGMFTLATVHPMPTAPLAIPKLNLTGRVPPRNATVTLDHIETPAQMTDWPEFHNGVAAGLKIAPGISKLDSTWIVFNQPSENQGSIEYAGFLMALGLNGHLVNLTEFETMEYLQTRQEQMVIGLLIGLSASRCGSMELSMASILTIFFPPLLPEGSVDMENSILMQTAAMIGLGLLYLGSCHRFMAETMLKQIGHAPGPELDFAQNRECYSLTAGLALGMIGLGAGGEALSLADLNLVDQLCLYIKGGRKRDVLFQDSGGPSHLVLERERVNTHVTAPGAILALGLLYLKTNDEDVARHLLPPSTQLQLEKIRPDFFMLMLLSRGLIMWNSVKPSRDWVTSNIPKVVLQNAFLGPQQGDSTGHADEIDYQTMSQCYLNISAGSCLAIGFRYAGTGNAAAYSCLLQYVEQFLKFSPSSVEQVGRHCVESCLSATLLALTVVMSGSGDIEVLRIIRKLHGQVNFNYGRHMAVHMAAGLLFLGGGRYSLSRSNRSIAALLCALYPQFPISSTDNRYHLQALRHLFVLGAEPRVLLTRDTDTNTLCSVPVKVHCPVVCGISESCDLSGRTPFILPDWDTLEEIEVEGPRYWPVKISLLDENIRQVVQKTGTIYVKRRTGCLSYEDDPMGQQSLLSLASLSPNQYQLGGVTGPMDVTGSLLTAGSTMIKDFFNELCTRGRQCYSAALLDCIARERIQLLEMYLQLEEVGGGAMDVLGMWQLKLSHAFALADRDTLPGMDYVEGVRIQIKHHLRNKIAQRLQSGGGMGAILKRYIKGENPCSNLVEAEVFAMFLGLYEIPSPVCLPCTVESTEELLSSYHSKATPKNTTAAILLNI